jgi:hypothetical protein
MPRRRRKLRSRELMRDAQAVAGLLNRTLTPQKMPHQRFTDLFKQLGLPCDATAIADFLKQHRSLSDDIRLEDAPFWTPWQSSFLKEQLANDAEWAVLVDQLSLALR